MFLFGGNIDKLKKERDFDGLLKNLKSAPAVRAKALRAIVELLSEGKHDQIQKPLGQVADWICGLEKPDEILDAIGDFLTSDDAALHIGSTRLLVKMRARVPAKRQLAKAKSADIPQLIWEENHIGTGTETSVANDWLLSAIVTAGGAALVEEKLKKYPFSDSLSYWALYAASQTIDIQALMRIIPYAVCTHYFCEPRSQEKYLRTIHLLMQSEALLDQHVSKIDGSPELLDDFAEKVLKMPYNRESFCAPFGKDIIKSICRQLNVPAEEYLRQKSADPKLRLEHMRFDVPQETVQPPLPDVPTEDLDSKKEQCVNEIKAAVEANKQVKTIDLIMLVRGKTGMTLVEAKGFVEKVLSELTG